MTLTIDSTDPRAVDPTQGSPRGNQVAPAPQHDVSIDELRATDQKLKPQRATDEWRKLHAFFEDRSRHLTEEHLADVEMGIRENCIPVEYPAVRRLIRRLSTVYKAPASRTLVGASGTRLAKNNATQKLYREILKRARKNARMRHLDRMRSLFSQIVVRCYPSDHKQGLRLVSFSPYQVMRWPSSSDPESIAADHAFALLVGKHGDQDIWEFWRRSGNDWRMTKVYGDGAPLEHQPFARSQLDNPYPVVPVHVLYVEDPDGRPWIPPRMSRLATQLALNAKANDLMSLVRSEAHTDEFFSGVDEEELPKTTAHGMRHALPKDAGYHPGSKQPKIAESIESFFALAKFASVCEGLPSADLDDAKTILTGAALRVQEGELRELREEQVELALLDEETLFDIERGVHNAHASEWGMKEIPESVSLHVQIAEVDTPDEPKNDQDFAHAEIEKGYMHPIQWFMRRDQVDEETAIETWEHVKELYKRYPADEKPPKPEPTPEPKNPPGHPGGEREIDPDPTAIADDMGDS